MSDTDGGGSTGSGELAAWLLTEGLPWVTTAEIVRGLLGLLVAHVARLQRWIWKGLLFSPTKGGYVPIPPNYRAWGTVPGLEFIDAMRLACRGRGGAPRATSGGPDWDGIAQVAQQSFVEPVDTVFGFVRVIDGHYPGAEFIGVERPDSSLLSVKRGIAQLVTEDFEVALASRYVAHFFDTTGLAAASVRAKVDRWIADGRIVVHNDPEVIPAWRPPDHDQPVEQSAAAWPRRRVHRRVASTITPRSENSYS